jgi:hypothetical protein
MGEGAWPRLREPVFEVNRGRQALTQTIPAPVGGLNARDALAAMPATDASVMTNLFPFADKVRTRGGYTTLATLTAIGMANTVEGWRRLMVHTGGGTETIFGAYFWQEDVGGTARDRLRIYSIATDGTFTSSREVVTLGSATELGSVGEWTLFTAGAGVTYLLLMVVTQAGGAYTQVPQAYSGSAWSAPAITGLPEIALGVHSHRNRLWFYNCGSVTGTAKPLSVYYLAPGAIAGAVTEFNLGPFASKGGTVVAVRTLSLDGGDGGTDDLAVFVTDQGQVIIYSGYDPSSPSTWSLAGVFDVGKLASWQSTYAVSGDPQATVLKNAFAMEYGSDVLIYAQQGIVSVKKLLAQSADGDITLSGKIRPLITDEVTTWNSISSRSAWKMEHAPLIRHLIVSVTSQFASSATTRSWSSNWYVMNTETGAWTKYLDFPMVDSVLAGNKIYMTDGGRGISTFDNSATSDNGSVISYECRQAYNNLGSFDNKLFTLMMPMLQSTGNFSLTMNADVDFKARDISAYTSYTTTGSLQPALSPSIYGATAAAHLKGQTSAGVLSWFATKWVAKQSLAILSTV